jgi:hypothetical protein
MAKRQTKDGEPEPPPLTRDPVTGEITPAVTRDTVTGELVYVPEVEPQPQRNRP